MRKQRKQPDQDKRKPWNLDRLLLDRYGDRSGRVRAENIPRGLVRSVGWSFEERIDIVNIIDDSDDTRLREAVSILDETFTHFRSTNIARVCEIEVIISELSSSGLMNFALHSDIPKPFWEEECPMELVFYRLRATREGENLPDHLRRTSAYMENVALHAKNEIVAVEAVIAIMDIAMGFENTRKQDVEEKAVAECHESVLSTLKHIEKEGSYESARKKAWQIYEFLEKQIYRKRQCR